MRLTDPFKSDQMKHIAADTKAVASFILLFSFQFYEIKITAKQFLFWCDTKFGS